jgi:hypothetical protein
MWADAKLFGGDKIAILIAELVGDTLQAAILNVKLPHLDAWARSRQANAQRYDALFTDCGLHRQLTLPQTARLRFCRGRLRKRSANSLQCPRLHAICCIFVKPGISEWANNLRWRLNKSS